MKPYRMLATQVVAAQGYTPIVEEHFHLPADAILQELKAKITGCAGVIALVGPYYGTPSPWIRDGVTMSYTQFELVFARGIGKPCLTLLTDGAFEAPRAEDGRVYEEPAELARRQERFRAEIEGDAHGAWSLFRDNFGFAMALARHRWREWLGDR